MLDMANKETRNKYATIKNGRTLPVEELKPKETGGVEEIGIWIEGKAQEQVEGDYRELRITTKSNAKLTRRDTSNKPKLPLAKVGEGDFVAEVYTQTVARILSYIQYLVQYKPPYKKGEWHINNIAEVCRFLGIQYRTFTEGLSFIASRNLPYITARGGHFFYKDYRKLVGVRVKMRTRDTMAKGEGYITQKEEEILDKNAVIDTIILRPTKEFFNGLGVDSYGKQLSKEEFKKVGGLGNILLPIQSIKYSKNESLMEFRLRNFFISNTPIQRYKLDTLLTEVGITAEDIKKQGKPRYKKQIELELDSLQNRGLIKYSYSKKTKVYYITVKEKAYKHPDFYKENKSIAVNTENRKQKID